MAITISILEDDEKVSAYLSALITGSPEMSVLHVFSSAEEAIQAFDTGNEVPDVMLTDMELPGKSGVDFINWFKPKFPGVQILVLSSYNDPEKVFNALKSGASGYVLKSTPSTKIIEAITDMSQGGSPMSSQIARMVVSAFQQPPIEPYQTLSVREKEVIHWLAQGYRYMEIADKLYLSVETVRTHIRNIYEKLHAKNRTEALRNAGLNG